MYSKNDISITHDEICIYGESVCRGDFIEAYENDQFILVVNQLSSVYRVEILRKDIKKIYDYGIHTRELPKCMYASDDCICVMTSVLIEVYELDDEDSIAVNVGCVYPTIDDNIDSSSIVISIREDKTLDMATATMYAYLDNKDRSLIEIDI